MSTNEQNKQQKSYTGCAIASLCFGIMCWYMAFNEPTNITDEAVAKQTERKTDALGILGGLGLVSAAVFAWPSRGKGERE